jgi:hypothetical protein
MLIHRFRRYHHSLASLFTTKMHQQQGKWLGTKIASSKCNASYITLVSLRNKLTCLNSVITRRPLTDSKMSLVESSWSQRHTTMSKVKNMDTSPALSPSQSTGLSLETQRGSTPYLPTQARTLWQHLQLECSGTRRIVCCRAQDPDKEPQ